MLDTIEERQTINTEVLKTAIFEALCAGGLEPDTEDDIAQLISRVCHDGAGEVYDELQWWRSVLAVVDPVIELVAAVAANPLGDNAEAAKTAIESIETEMIAHSKESSEPMWETARSPQRNNPVRTESATADLATAKRKKLGGGIDWAAEPLDEAERSLRAATLESMGSLELWAMITGLLPHSIPSDWPSDVRRAYETADQEETRDREARTADAMRERIEAAKLAGEKGRPTTATSALHIVT